MLLVKMILTAITSSGKSYFDIGPLRLRSETDVPSGG